MLTQILKSTQRGITHAVLLRSGVPQFLGYCNMSIIDPPNYSSNPITCTTCIRVLQIQIDTLQEEFDKSGINVGKSKPKKLTRSQLLRKD